MAGVVVRLVFSHAPCTDHRRTFSNERLSAHGVRYSGTWLGAQLAAVLAGGTSPIIATLLLSKYGTSALSLYLIAMALVTVIAVLLASETHRDARFD